MDLQELYFQFEAIDIDRILKNRHSPIKNYVTPGLTSWLVEKDKHLKTKFPKEATLRLFETSRCQQEAVTPHSHRFHFASWVLKGSMVNRLWRPHDAGDDFMMSTLKYNGSCTSENRYNQYQNGIASYFYDDWTYRQGEGYTMDCSEIHSVYFRKNTLILIIEGPQVSGSSIILEPYVDEEVISTFKVEPWMFKK